MRGVSKSQTIMALATITITGTAELSRLFRKTPKAMNAKVIRSVAGKAGALIVSEARRQIKGEKTGNLKRSIGVIRPRFKASSHAFAYVVVGARVGGRGKGNRSGYHAHWIAYGTAERKWKKNRKSVGAVGDGEFTPLGSWIQEAAGQVENRIHEKMHSSLQPILEREMKKHARP